MAGLISDGEKLYWVTPNNNSNSGLDVWATSGGADWRLVNILGFGDPNNNPTYWDNAAAFFGGDLYVSAWNSTNGAEIWVYKDEEFYLPIIRR